MVSSHGPFPHRRLKQIWISSRFIPTYRYCWRRVKTISQFHKLKRNTNFTKRLYSTPQMENKDPCVFEYSKDDFVYQTARWDDVKAPQISKFDKELRSLWDENMENGVFKYSMDHVKTKILAGPKKYVAQLNDKRATERRKPQTIMSVSQPFNPELFNFQKVHTNEILFSLHNTDENQSNGNGTVGAHLKKAERNIVIINISPLEYGHVLIVPQVDHSLPQILTETAMKVVLEAMLLSRHRGFKLGYNSLCGYASVNHLHFHAYYLEHELMIEYCDVKSLGHNVFEQTAMPCHGFAFQLHGSTVKELTTLICRITEYFVKNDIAHNLFITRGTVFGEPQSSDKRTIRLYLWARKKFLGSKVTHEFNVAVIELGGHLLVKDEESYDSLTEEMSDSVIQESRLPEDEYKQIKDEVLQIAQQVSSVQANNS